MRTAPVPPGGGVLLRLLTTLVSGGTPRLVVSCPSQDFQVLVLDIVRGIDVGIHRMTVAQTLEYCLADSVAVIDIPA